MKMARKATPVIAACSHLFQRPIFANSRSRITAGTVGSSGNSAGRRWGTCRYPGPGAELDGDDPGDQYEVRRAEYFHVQAVGFVPPVVERCRSQHGHSAPGGDERAERTAEAPDPDRRRPGRGVAGERRRKDEIAAGQSGENAGQVDRDVGGSPERIAADRAMPGDVPVG